MSGFSALRRGERRPLRFYIYFPRGWGLGEDSRIPEGGKNEGFRFEGRTKESLRRRNQLRSPGTKSRIDPLLSARKSLPNFTISQTALTIWAFEDSQSKSLVKNSESFFYYALGIVFKLLYNKHTKFIHKRIYNIFIYYRYRIHLQIDDLMKKKNVFTRFFRVSIRLRRKAKWYTILPKSHFQY